MMELQVLHALRNYSWCEPGVQSRFLRYKDLGPWGSVLVVGALSVCQCGRIIMAKVEHRRYIRRGSLFMGGSG